MAKGMIQEPRHANDYDDRTTAAVKSVLLEIGQVLGSFQGKFAVIGGSVPWLLLENPEMRHVGTQDVDLDLQAEALGDGEYTKLIDALRHQGYEQCGDKEVFQLVRSVPARDGGPAIDVVVDFLMPRDAKFKRNKPPLIEKFAVLKADGADLALKFYQMVAIDGDMPDGGTNKVEIAVCSIPALLAMKGYALKGRLKQKDAYDVYYSIRNYPGGIAALAKDCLPLLEHDSGRAGFAVLNEKFDTVDGFGPTCVRQFVTGSKALDGRTPEQWQQDAFGQVDALLRALALRN